jgi:ATP-binding cassette subfamily C protein/ATP-binding cassette subfamily C protein EexD
LAATLEQRISQGPAMKTKPTPLSAAITACYPALGSTFILSLFINLALLVSPLYSMQVYDRVLTSRNVGTLLMLTLIVAAFLALYGVLEYARSGVLVRTGVAFEGKLRRPLFDTMMRAEMSPRHRLGQQVIRDAELLRDCMSSNLASTLCDLPWTPFYVLLCFLLHPLLGMVALMGAFISFALALITDWVTKPDVERSNRLSNEANKFAAAALRNGEAVRGLGMGDIVLDRWAGQQSQALAASAMANERGAVLLAISKFSRMAVQTSLLCVGAWLAVENLISPGAMMAASIVMGRALAPVEQIVGQWKRIVAARSAYRRLDELFRALPAETQSIALPAPMGRIEVEGAVVFPPAATKASVRGVSFDLEPGDVLAVVGNSSGGKSSLARAMAGVWQLKSGTIRIDGASFSQWDPHQLGKHIGYLPQDVDLFAGTIAENIARMGQIDDEMVVAAARQAGAHEAILRLSDGYETRIGESGTALSGGMRQRIGLARALYGNPRLIVLDEPNANLDEEGERALAKALGEMKAARQTVIMVTHRPSILQYVDKVLVMSFGQALAFGDRDDVIARMRGNKVAVVSERRQVAGSATAPAAIERPAAVAALRKPQTA